MNDWLSGVLFFHSETGTEGGWPAFQDGEYIAKDGWSYEGLHILHDGDELVVIDPEGVEVFSGTVQLDVLHPYTDEKAAWGVFWMNRELAGISREEQMVWFFKEYPAYWKDGRVDEGARLESG